MKDWKEKGMQGVFFLAACVSVLAVALICIFLFANGIPAMSEIGIFDFLLGEEWRPSNNIYGILPMIMGSIYVTAGAIVIGVPVGIFHPRILYALLLRKDLSVFKISDRTGEEIPSVVMRFLQSEFVINTTLVKLYCSTGNRRNRTDDAGSIHYSGILIR